MWTKNQKQNSWIWGWLVVYMMALVVWMWFSYGLVTPNLVLSGHPVFWRWQQWMWTTFFNNRELTSWIFGGLLTWLGVAYGGLMVALGRSAEKAKLTGKKMAMMMILVSWPLLFSYNLLSADVFNYVFNAKMVVTYGADPHVLVAQDFPQDEMLRFMHNSHTAAPYGYLWTAISIPFYVLGAGKFIGAWLMMRMAGVVSLGLVGWLIWKWGAKMKDGKNWRTRAAWLLLNPLLLIEVVGNAHNDLWMMAGVVASLYLVWDLKEGEIRGKWLKIIGSLVLLAASTQIKFASLVAVPFWLYLVGGREVLKSWRKKQGEKKNGGWTWLWGLQAWGEKYFFEILALAFFVPLLTARSQMFHPWYWTWVLVWLPFCRVRWVRWLMVAFSFSSLWRYLPYILIDEHSQELLKGQQWITFGGAVVLLGLIFVCDLVFGYKKSKKGEV